jgi:hypothetical protein
MPLVREVLTLGSTTRTESFFPGHEAADEAVDQTTPRTDDYNERNKQFTGRFDKVTVGPKRWSTVRGDTAGSR